ncbi:PqiC family protein [Trinickia fusca]|uniref:Membrane integrity-associated transporter subunit PqiC n=1 Tax=Trinickia fusca TaxID=2419777 RepID=A0A494XSG7_9BURK|nr:PqiC family protein [Trinickia fusca]RKP51064.1 membrane integrity-associated transporter subunit PqiC [Trinickia fusca]
MTLERFPYSLRTLALVAACAGAAMLTACSSSPPSRFYTLGAGSSTSNAATPSNSAAPAIKPAFLIEVPPVDVPSQIARNQLVVQTSEARVDVLEQERWASMPADEIRRAVSGDLAARLGTFDVFGTPYPDGVPVYRISVNVQRFESWPASHTVLAAVWSVRAVHAQSGLTCRTRATEQVGAGYDALVEGHRRALAQMADEITVAVRQLAAGAGAGTLAAHLQDCAIESRSPTKPGGA